MEQTDPRHLLVNIAKILERLKIPYLVTGGMAVLVWGRPRFTADIDIVIKLKQENIDSFKKALMAFSRAGYVDESVMREAVSKKGEFNFIDGETGVKVDFWVLKEANPFDASQLERKKVKNILGQKVYFISPEDLILSKIKWYQESQSSRQLEDVESILKISGRKLDTKYLKQWAKRLGVLGILNKLEKQNAQKI